MSMTQETPYYAIINFNLNHPIFCQWLLFYLIWSLSLLTAFVVFIEANFSLQYTVGSIPWSYGVVLSPSLSTLLLTGNTTSSDEMF